MMSLAPADLPPGWTQLSRAAGLGAWAGWVLKVNP